MKTSIQAIVALGLCLSALACLLLAVHFFSLAATLYSVPTPVSPEQIVASSEAWSEAVRDFYYSMSGFLITFIVSLLVCVMLAFRRFRNRRSLAKMLLVVSASFLNAFFLWTAHVLEAEIGAALRILVFTAIYDATALGIPYPQDSICLGLLLTTVVIAFLLGTRRGIGLAVARATQAGSLVVAPLGLEVYLFDRSEYNLHLTVVQQALGLAWFTNADLLYLSAIIFVSTTVLLFLSRQHYRFHGSA
jgi:hypothetical protein